MASAIVTNIQGYSIHDGDGIRTVIFLKGCPLQCKWCANPENISGAVQLGFLARLCAGCGKCAKVCTRGAIISGSGVYRINRSVCVECFSCADACYYDALVKYGSEMSASEAYAKAEKDRMFYESSGGGITVSGGEPLMHIDFVYELFSLCAGGGISTCVETCGHVPWAHIERILPLTGQFYFDIKCMDSDLHRRYTGVGNELILNNARQLAKSGAGILFRQPFIPGVNTDPEQIKKTADFIKSLDGNQRLQLMPYHRMGKAKYDALNIPYEMEHTEIMPADELLRAQELFSGFGIECTVSR